MFVSVPLPVALVIGRVKSQAGFSTVKYKILSTTGHFNTFYRFLLPLQIILNKEEDQCMKLRLGAQNIRGVGNEPNMNGFHRSCGRARKGTRSL